MEAIRDTKLKRMLPRKYFVCEEVFQQELQELFAQDWLCLFRTEELAFGDFRTYTSGPFSLVVLRSSDGTIRAFHNVCRHRGTRLIDCETGRLKNGCVVCPYHAWTYDQDGCLIGAPNMLDDPDFDREEFGLIPVETEIWNGFVFVRIEKPPTGCGLEQALAPVNDLLEGWSIDQLVIGTELNYDVAANWKILFQNYSECYHCPTVHPDLNQLTPYKSATNNMTQGPILGGPMLLEDSVETMSRDGKFCGQPIASLSSEQQRQVVYYTVFPSVFISTLPDYVMIHYLQPISPANTKIRCQFLVVSGSENGEGRLKIAVDFWDEVNRQDWEVCEQTQKGVTSPAYVPGPYSSLESMVMAFDDHYRKVFASGADE